MAYRIADCRVLLQNDPRAVALNAHAPGWTRLGTRSLPNDSRTLLRVFFDDRNLLALLVETPEGLRIEGYADSTERLRALEKTVVERLNQAERHDSTVGVTTDAARAMTIALAFRDYWDTLDGRPATHSGAGGMLGQRWPDLRRALLTNADELDETLSPLMEQAVSTPGSLRVLTEGLAWCFHNDAAYLAQSMPAAWDAGSVELVVRPKRFDPGIDTNRLTLPTAYLPGFHALPGGVVGYIATSPAGQIDGRAAMCEAFQTMSRLGFTFDLEMQDELGRRSDHDEDFPLHLKVPTLVPEAFPDQRSTVPGSGIPRVNARRP